MPVTSRSPHKAGQLIGGIRQRMRKAAFLKASGSSNVHDTVSHEIHTTGLGDYLLEKVGWKEISAYQGQQIAALAMNAIVHALNAAGTTQDFQAKIKQGGAEDLASAFCPDLSKLSKLGSKGAHPNNCHRDLMQALGEPTVPYSRVYIPLRLPDSPKVKNVEQHIIWPHLLLEKLGSLGGDVWERRVAGKPGRLFSFWRNMRGHPNYSLVRRHFLELGIDHWEHCCVPLKLYGDGCPVTGVGKSWSKSMNNYIFSSMVSEGSSAETLFIIWSVMTALMEHNTDAAKDSYKVFWNKLKWSLEICCEGAYPKTDDKGKPYSRTSVLGKLAGKPLVEVDGRRMYFVPWLLTGDLEYMYKDHMG